MERNELLKRADDLFNDIKAVEQQSRHNTALESDRVEIHDAFSQVKFNCIADAMHTAYDVAGRVSRNVGERNLVLQRLRETLLDGNSDIAVQQIQKEY